MIDLNQFEGHTPGPWLIYAANKKWKTFQIDGPSTDKPGTNAAAVVHWAGFDSGDRPIEKKRANAKLIAAAPALLAECKRQRDTIAELHAAFAKVRKLVADTGAFPGVVR